MLLTDSIRKHLLHIGRWVDSVSERSTAIQQTVNEICPEWCMSLNIGALFEHSAVATAETYRQPYNSTHPLHRSFVSSLKPPCLCKFPLVFMLEIHFHGNHCNSRIYCSAKMAFHCLLSNCVPKRTIFQ